MKTFTISTLALVLAPTAVYAQLSNAPERQREASENDDRRRRHQQRQLERGGNRTRTVDRSMSMPEMVAAEMDMPKPEMLVDSCASHNKRKCSKDESCTWGDLVCVALADGAPSIESEFLGHGSDPSISMSMPETSMPTSTPTSTPTYMPTYMLTTDSCASFSKRQCSKDETCIWDHSVCHTITVASAGVVRSIKTDFWEHRLRRNDPSMSMPEMASEEMSMPMPTQELTEQTEDSCAILTKKKCRKDETCTWDDTVCYSNTVDSTDTFSSFAPENQEIVGAESNSATPTRSPISALTPFPTFTTRKLNSVELSNDLHNSARSLATSTSVLAIIYTVMNLVM